jgi:hypothetical protein
MILHLAAVKGRNPWRILDGNLGPILEATHRTLEERPHALVGVAVMPRQQVAPAVRPPQRSMP